MLLATILAEKTKESVHSYRQDQIRGAFLGKAPRGSVQVVFPSVCISRTYPANQFVAVLLGEVSRSEGGVDPFSWKRTVVAAFCEGERRNADASYGRDTVVFRLPDGAKKPMRTPGVFNVVLNRIGAVTQRRVLSVVQMLPFWPPYLRRADVLP